VAIFPYDFHICLAAHGFSEISITKLGKLFFLEESSRKAQDFMYFGGLELAEDSMTLFEREGF
jgi:hypothetical protein